MRAYERHGDVWTGSVSLASDEALEVDVDPPQRSGSETKLYFHPKQCRRLVKKERRRIWVSRALRDVVGFSEKMFFAFPIQDYSEEQMKANFDEFIEIRSTKCNQKK